MAEGAPLLRAYTLTGIEGSNPSVSATGNHQLIDLINLIAQLNTVALVTTLAFCSKLISRGSHRPVHDPARLPFKSENSWRRSFSGITENASAGV